MACLFVIATSVVLLHLWFPLTHTKHTRTLRRLALPPCEWNASWWSGREHKRLNCRVNHFPTQTAFRMQQSGLGRKITTWALWLNNKSCHSYVFIPTCSLAAYLTWQLMIHCRTIYGLCLNSEPRRLGLKQVKLLFNYIISGPMCAFYYRFPEQLLLRAGRGNDQARTSHLGTNCCLFEMLSCCTCSGVTYSMKPVSAWKA